ncbi:Osmotic growth protein 1 [Coelomomyces lativittatus]|nr:Osmotic growth protein 1 [Coelomomyces lativittatus]KAJ1515899.1 Osmotic growth protein 1 [Coelomomyces lativittatus]
MNAVGTLAQQVGCIEDSVDAFYEDTVRSGGSRSDPWLVQRLVSLSKEAHAFLESFGIQLNQLSQCGGHRFPRTHREAPDGSGQPKSVGWDIVKALQKYIETEMHTKSNPSFGSIQFKMNTQVLDLIVDQGRVKGIKFTHTNSTAPTEPLFGTSSSSSSSIEVTSLMTDAVILTTGG